MFNVKDISVYIHWPFCITKCPYCDFNSYNENLIKEKTDEKLWLNAYLNLFEISVKAYEGKYIKSIFFGGGTPSLMKVDTIKVIVDYFNKINKMNNNPPVEEITLESNPSTFEINKFKEFKAAGVNRLSIGVQSFHEENLQFLGRNHNVREAKIALEKSYEIYNKVSFDLIMGLPKQTFDNLKEDVNVALQFPITHLSIYQLTIEPNTLFYKQQVKSATEENGVKFYNYILQELAKQNINRYEISNYAKKSYESIHNLNYWQGGSYIAFGPGAHSRVFYNNQWISLVDTKSPNKWLQQALESKVNEDLPFYMNRKSSKWEAITLKERYEEIILTHLRLNQNIPNWMIGYFNYENLQQAISEKLIIKEKNTYKVTNLGFLCLNHLIFLLLT